MLIFDGKTADAIVMLEEASQKYGTGVELCEALAYAYSQEGKFADAAMCFEKASDLKGGDPSLQISAAKTYEQAGVLDSAIKAYEKYLKLKPGDAVAWKSLASCCVKAEYYEDALKHYLAAIKAIGRDPNTTEAAEIGELFIKNGNAHQAQRWLEAAYAVTLPENAEVKKKLLSNLIAVYLSLKDMGKLERAVNDADAIDKNLVESAYPGLHAKIADFKAKLKEAEEAFKTEQKKKAARMRPRSLGLFLSIPASECVSVCFSFNPLSRLASSCPRVPEGAPGRRSGYVRCLSTGTKRSLSDFPANPPL